MTKIEYISYISCDNPGKYKTRKTHIKKRFPEIFKEIEQFIINNNLTPINFGDGLKYYINDRKTQNKCICGNIIGYYYIYCSKTCMKDNIEDVLLKRKNTCKERYGVEYTFQAESVKEKTKQTWIKNYGVEHPAQNEEILLKIKASNNKTYENKDLRIYIGKKISKAYKENGDEILEKKRQTNFKKHGEYTLRPSSSALNAKNTLNKRYHTTNPFKIHEDTYQLAKLGSIKFYENEENKNNAIQKRINTIISKYGSLEKMNEFVFQKTKQKTLQYLKNIGVKDEILQYEYNNLGFVKCKGKECNHEYEISLHLLRERTQRNDICCIICSPPIKYVSDAETEIYNWLSKYINCQQSNRKLLKGSEIDIYIPEKKLAIEYNGIYWHSDLFKDKNYHLNKTLFLKNLDIQLIHIWEDLWETKKEIIKGRILSKLNIDQLNIGARKCILKEITSLEANNFYENNHLQGKTNGFKHIALIFNNEIISSLSMGKRKLGKNKSTDTFEILRFCNKSGINCMGSFSRLFKYVIDNYPGKYISYADLCWGEGNVYEHAGFKLREYSKPNYWYFLENKRYHRYAFNKQRLIKLGYNKTKTEFQIMNEIKALRIYDCGNAVWEYVENQL